MPRPDPDNASVVELELETSRGNHINNAQDRSAVPVGTIWALEKRFALEFPGIKRRTQTPTGEYNCHGLVFAARRTAVWEPDQVKEILKDDGYQLIPDDEVLPGDIALYISAKGAIDHSAVVVELAGKDALFKIHKVFSKWGPWVEVVHWANECPYAREPDVIIRYYRLVR
jgi:hypothetical protein